HWVHHHFKEDVQPLALRAPEVVLGHAWNQSVDVWGLGCLGIELLVGFAVFAPNFFETHRPIDEDHLAQMTDVTGEQFTPVMLSSSQYRSKFFNEDGTLPGSSLVPYGGLKQLKTHRHAYPLCCASRSKLATASVFH
ncbi:hypothetical protein FRC06_009872, partial [Ceratobasidium sp. 370]